VPRAVRAPGADPPASCVQGRPRRHGIVPGPRLATRRRTGLATRRPGPPLCGSHPRRWTTALVAASTGAPGAERCCSGGGRRRAGGQRPKRRPFFRRRGLAQEDSPPAPARRSAQPRQCNQRRTCSDYALGSVWRPAGAPWLLALLAGWLAACLAAAGRGCNIGEAPLAAAAAGNHLGLMVWLVLEGAAAAEGAAAEGSAEWAAGGAAVVPEQATTAAAAAAAAASAVLWVRLRVNGSPRGCGRGFVFSGPPTGEERRWGRQRR
jgi:hypothetical protein